MGGWVGGGVGGWAPLFAKNRAGKILLNLIESY